MKSNLRVRIAAEFLGTGFLVSAVVGPGIMAERLSGGNVALTLLANTIATGAALVALVLAFGPISGAHLKPVVSVADGMEGGLAWSETLPYEAFYSGPSGWTGSITKRVRRDIWPTFCDLGMFPFRYYCVCRGELHHGSLLVHGVYVLRESCREQTRRRTKSNSKESTRSF
jgi:hypothetical protein